MITSISGELAPYPSTGPKQTVFPSRTLAYLHPTQEEMSNANGIVELAKREEPVQEAYDLFALYNDTFTKEHSERAAYAGVIIADRLHLPDEDQFWTGVIALLHDVGKENEQTQPIIQSTEHFEGEARERAKNILHKHPQAGANIVLTSGWAPGVSELIASAVGSHQLYSRSDPYGKPPDEAVELPAKIVCAVDKFDAYASERTYKKIWSFKRSKAELYRDFTGGRFIVDAFFRPTTRTVIDLEPTTITLPEQSRALVN